MAENSNIGWCHHTANLWWGCTVISPGCDNCYANITAQRWDQHLWGEDKNRLEVKGVWKDLVRFQKKALAANEIHRVFVGSMMDIAELSKQLVDRQGIKLTFEDKQLSFTLPKTTGHLRAKFFAEYVDQSPNLDLLLLSKRPSNYNKLIPPHWHERPPVNVMFGTSIVSKKTRDTLLPQLKKVNGRRFLSLEPQLEMIDEIDLTGIHWVIEGGESGAGRRPFNTAWAYRMRDICREQNVPYFFKQVDKVLPIPDDLMIREFPSRPLLAA